MGDETAPLSAVHVEPVVERLAALDEACYANEAAEKELEQLRQSLAFYKRRCDLLQAWQSSMRDPERTLVCDVLANGQTLSPAVAGNRYGAMTPNAIPFRQRNCLLIDNKI